MGAHEPRTYSEAEELYRRKGGIVVPVKDKRPLGKGWANRAPSKAEISQRCRQYASNAFGLLAGTGTGEGHQLTFIDVDHDCVVRFVRSYIGESAPEKVGAKGATFIVQTPCDTKSSKIRRKGAAFPIVEIMANSGMTVLPESPHPSGGHYHWVGPSLLSRELSDLPIVSPQRIAVMKAVLENETTWKIIEGGADIRAHDLMLALTASGIANGDEDLAPLARALGELFHPAYAGDTKEKILGMLETAREKKLGAKPAVRSEYDPGDFGPRPLGFTSDGGYVLLDPMRNIIVIATAQQLLSMQWQLGLAPSDFWSERFPAKRAAYNSMAAGEALIAATRSKGPFKLDQVRGRGVWREGERIVVNFGQPVESKRYQYLCFTPIHISKCTSFDTVRLWQLLNAFHWRDSKDAMLMLGWLALAPICGALTWRTHAFVFGPARSGKTTIHHIAAALLEPVAVKADGQSSEAGIRQALGPDSLPVMLDEFESDHQAHRIQAVLRLSRSASSANTPVLRGTPEGKAMQFSLRTMFFFAAINPRGMTPADQSRIVMLELLMHDNSSEKARFILTEEAHFRSVGENWCGYVIAHVSEVVATIDKLEPLIASGDRRHRQNMANLLGAGFVALHGRIPTDKEAADWADEYAPLVERHGQEIERDDSRECLDHLFGQVHEANTLGMWVAEARAQQAKALAHQSASRMLDLFDMRLYSKPDGVGLVIRNGSPAIEKIFQNTRWANGAWQRALRKLDGFFVPKDPVQFRSAKAKARSLGIPDLHLPDQQPDEGF